MSCYFLTCALRLNTQLPETLNIALVQAQIAWQEPSENRNHLQSLMAGINERVDLIVLPETFTTGFLGESPAISEEMHGPTLEWMQSQANVHQAVITGSTAIFRDEGFVNRLLWVDPDGAVEFYDKRHLFAMAGESDRYIAGTQRRVWRWNDWRVCPQICYDLRFPVWSRNRGDYDLLIYVANWPAPRLDAWSTLLKARAMENQCYVIGVNRVGKDGNGKTYPGASCIIDPLGRPVVEAGGEETIVYGEIDIEMLRSVRKKFPFQVEADPFKMSS
jgi:omega-amidase